MKDILRRLVAAAALVTMLAAVAPQHQRLTASPVRNPSRTITQPDGTQIAVIFCGDEWQNWITNLEGNLLLQDAEGYYRPATASQLADFEAAQREAEARREQINAARRERMEQRRAQQRQAALRSASATSTNFPTSGKVKILVALVQYQNVKFTVENPYEEFNNWLNQPRYNKQIGNNKHYGSVRDYFVENSFGQFEPEFTVIGPLTLKHNREYYGENNSAGNDKYAYEMVIEACEQADSLGIDFTEYDANNDGVIDAVCVIYAGEGANATRISTMVWPHQWDIESAMGGASKNTYTFDGKKLSVYECVNETYKGSLDGIGTFCHEFGHVLDLPDLYHTNSIYSACSPCNYSVMDRGSYLKGGCWPCGYSTFERLSLGWLSPTLLESDTEVNITLSCLQNSNQAYYIPIERATHDANDPFSGEYYLFENRQKTKWDLPTPAHGLLIWHIDYTGDRWYNNTVNNWTNHQCVDLVEADGHKRGSDGNYIQDDTATFPGAANHTEFSQRTTPAFAGWARPGTSNSTLTNFQYKPLSNIHEVADPDDPSISLLKFTFMDPDIVSVGIEQVHADNVTNRRRIVWREGRMVIETDDGERMTLFGTK